MSIENDFEVLRSERLVDSFLTVSKDTIRHLKHNGKYSRPLDRLVISKANSVGVLLYNTNREVFILVNQFRYPARYDNHGFITEIVAGNNDPGESMEETVKREVFEETGYQLENMILIANGYSSPGICTEKLDLFYAEVQDNMKKGQGGGQMEEGEDIRIIEWTKEETLNKLKSHSIIDLKTLVAIQWFFINKVD